ncbi:MAG: lactonase family protein [Verrucomicrobiae bacterium]|nr:lactonase family protein [Verrucomicrobiae bacterium]
MKTPTPRLLLPALVLLGLLPSATDARADTVVYVSESKDNRIAVFSLDESSGDLTRLGETPMEGAPGCLAVSTDQKFLYAAVRSASQFATLAIHPDTGLLTPVGTSPAVGSAAYVFPDRTGNWLLGAYYGEGLVSVSRIADGVVTGEPVCVLDIGKKAHCIQTDPANHFAFCPHPVDLNRVDQFRFDEKTGQLSLNDPPAMIAGENHGPRHLQFHPNGKWVYVVNEQGKSVTLCDYDAEKGTLAMRQTLSTHPSDWDNTQGSCADIEISADGRFVYASNRGHDSIAAFAIDQSNGELTSLGQTPTEKTPRSFNLIPGGETFMVAAGQGSAKLVVYRRDPKSGAISPLKTYDCGQSPAWVMGLKLK